MKPKLNMPSDWLRASMEDFAMQRFAQISTRLLATLCVAGWFSSHAFAQADMEPNDSCPAAQDVGAFDGSSPLLVTGSLDTPPDEPDVDFFRFSAIPGASLVADLAGADTGQGTLPDPFLGLFDSDCNPVASNDDTGTFNSRLQFVVPADGVVILAATSCCDDQFTGAGDSSGSYELTVSPAPPAIGSIAGRVVDANTGEPLPGNSPPFAFVDLLRCDGVDCFEVVASQNTDDEGGFRFEGDFADEPLPAGTYQVRAFATEFQEEATEPFDVDEGEDFDVGDIALGPPPIAFSDIQPCEDLLPQGDTCRYSVTVRNNTNAPVEGLAWSPVNGFGLGSSLTFTLFEASTAGGSRQAVRARVDVDPAGDQALHFQFDVPPFVVGATFCPGAFLGVNPNPLVITVRETFLFCITGSDTGFEVMSESESQKIFKSLSGRSETLRRLPAAKRPK
jgi:hypothetical protein